MKMPILMQVNNEVVQHKVALSGQDLTIGRAADSDIQVEDRAVSGQHARIEWVKADNDQGGFYQLVDLDSTNGTFLNEKRLAEPAVLRHDDTIRIGFVSFRYLDENAQDFEQTAKIHKSWIPGVYYTKD
ncbi:FHA domain-containing protein [Saccharospirillum mangrovi]|uniref:FHA domain-containing protein n=2 Tax=Saccharospirillum mangrovi TaxID=2161747 RepID=UPI000D3CF1B1|nr:FHA domain-containing protein [Saccharospirillum mangrovi]